MDVETAHLLFYVIWGAGALVWCLALAAHLKAFRPPDPLHPEVLASGEEQVPAPREDVRERLLASLRGVGPGAMGSIRLTQTDDRHVAGTMDLFLRGGRSGDLGFDIALADAGRATRATWQVTGRPSSGLRLLSSVFVYLLGPLALAAAAYAMARWVLPSEDPGIRTQVVQTLQVVHVLWPPFLFAYLRRRIPQGAGRALANVIANAGVR